MTTEEELASLRRMVLGLYGPINQLEQTFRRWVDLMERVADLIEERRREGEQWKQ